MTNSVSIDLDDGRGRIEGYCASRFQPVLDVFVENFRQRGKVGASACVTFEGETVLDVWGGLAEPATGSAWTQDTVSLVFSSTKGIMALVANMLIERGLLDPFQPVAEIWPEFACNGKETATVRLITVSLTKSSCQDSLIPILTCVYPAPWAVSLLPIKTRRGTSIFGTSAFSGQSVSGS